MVVLHDRPLRTQHTLFPVCFNTTHPVPHTIVGRPSITRSLAPVPPSDLTNTPSALLHFRTPSPHLRLRPHVRASYESSRCLTTSNTHDTTPSILAFAHRSYNLSNRSSVDPHQQWTASTTSALPVTASQPPDRTARKPAASRISRRQHRPVRPPPDCPRHHTDNTPPGHHRRRRHPPAAAPATSSPRPTSSPIRRPRAPNPA